MVLLGIIGIAFLTGLSTASKATFLADERATAESLARSQMEDVKNQDYDASYAEISVPDGYDIDITAENFDADGDGTIEVPGEDDGIQKITVKIYHHDDAHVNPPVITLDGYKVDR